MLDKDQFTTKVNLICGCELEHTHFFKSGFQDDFYLDHIHNKLGIRFDNTCKFNDFLDLLDLPNFEYDYKFKYGQIEVTRLCPEHTNSFLRDILKNIRDYYLNKWV